MTPLRPILAFLLLVAGFLLVAGCVEGQGSGNVTKVPTTVTPAYSSSEIPVQGFNSTNETQCTGNVSFSCTSLSATEPALPDKIAPAQASCTPFEHREYRVIQGEPFTYQGIVPDSASRSVDVFVYSEISPVVFPITVPVKANGSFSVTISGNKTRQDWEDHLSTFPAPHIYSPYDHVCLKYSTGTDCFDLLLVQDAMNLTTITENIWIRIDPIPDQFVSANERSGYTGNFFINGTTNLPPDEEIGLSLFSRCYMMPCPKWSSYNHAIGCCGDGAYTSIANVREGSCGFNTWSIFVNTTPTEIFITTVNGVSGDYNVFEVDVSGRNRTADDNKWDAALFYGRLK
jgi:hypothetical protein